MFSYASISRGYCNQNHRPFNFLSEANSVNADSLLKIENLQEVSSNIARIEQTVSKNFEREDYLADFNARLKSIETFLKMELPELKREKEQYLNTRSFLTESFYEPLKDSLEAMFALKPTDPYQFIVV